MLLLQIIFKQLVLWLPWDLIISLQRSRAMRCSSSPIWCLRFMERCRISPLHLRRQVSIDADNVLIRLISRVTLLWRRRERGKSLNCRRKRKWRASNWWFNQINIRLDWRCKCLGWFKRHAVFWRGGNPILSYSLSSGAAANVSRLFHVWPPSTRGGWGYHHQDVFVVIIVNIIIGLKTTVLLSSKIKCPFPGETFLQVTRLLQGYIENEVKFQLFHKTWSYIYLQTDSQPSNH